MCSGVRSSIWALWQLFWTIIWSLDGQEMIDFTPTPLTLTTLTYIVHRSNWLFRFILVSFSHWQLSSFISCLKIRWFGTFASDTTLVSFDKERLLLFHRELISLERRVRVKIQVLTANSYVVWSSASQIYSWSGRISTSFRSLLRNIARNYSNLRYWISMTDYLLRLISLFWYFLLRFYRRHWWTCFKLNLIICTFAGTLILKIERFFSLWFWMYDLRGLFWIRLWNLHFTPHLLFDLEVIIAFLCLLSWVVGSVVAHRVRLETVNPWPSRSSIQSHRKLLFCASRLGIDNEAFALFTFARFAFTCNFTRRG